MFRCLTDLFSFYLDAVWAFFGRKATMYNEGYLSGRARYGLDRLEKAKAPAPESTQTSRPNVLFELNMDPLTLSEDCVLTSESLLFGLPARVTAMESLMFLATVIRSIRGNIENRLPRTAEKSVVSFYNDLVQIIPELRWLAYKNAVGMSVQSALQPMVKAMEKTKWDTKEILSQHSGYVDVLLTSLNVFTQRLNILGEARLPPTAYETIWLEVMEQVGRIYASWLLSNGIASHSNGFTLVVLGQSGICIRLCGGQKM